MLATVPIICQHAHEPARCHGHRLARLICRRRCPLPPHRLCPLPAARARCRLITTIRPLPAPSNNGPDQAAAKLERAGGTVLKRSDSQTSFRDQQVFGPVAGDRPKTCGALLLLDLGRCWRQRMAWMKAVDAGSGQRAEAVAGAGSDGGRRRRARAATSWADGDNELRAVDGSSMDDLDPLIQASLMMKTKQMMLEKING
ncbi:hypothetical protein ACLOJK_027710 [Asimina triloba]